MDWEKLWYEHWQEIYSYIFLRVRDSHEAEDLTQEVFIRAIKHHSGQVSYVPAMLRTIARNLVIDRWRKTHSVTLQSLEHQAETGVEARDRIEMFAAYDQQDELYQALQKLTKDQRQVITLRIIKGFSVRETASKLGKSEGAVKSLQYRALEAIRTEFSQYKSEGKDNGK